jgi:hypothetical protein
MTDRTPVFHLDTLWGTPYTYSMLARVPYSGYLALYSAESTAVTILMQQLKNYVSYMTLYHDSSSLIGRSGQFILLSSLFNLGLVPPFDTPHSDRPTA